MPGEKWMSHFVKAILLFLVSSLRPAPCPDAAFPSVSLIQFEHSRNSTLSSPDFDRLSAARNTPAARVKAYLAPSLFLVHVPPVPPAIAAVSFPISSPKYAETKLEETMFKSNWTLLSKWCSKSQIHWHVYSQHTFGIRCAYPIFVLRLSLTFPILFAYKTIARIQLTNKKIKHDIVADCTQSFSHSDLQLKGYHRNILLTLIPTSNSHAQ